MKNIEFSTIGKNVFLISFLCGTAILLGFCITKSWFFVLLGFYYIIISCIVNLIVFFSELLTFITDIADKKPHGNSALLLLLNIPITILYFFIFIKF
jgi:hypothetical protein